MKHKVIRVVLIANQSIRSSIHRDVVIYMCNLNIKQVMAIMFCFIDENVIGSPFKGNSSILHVFSPNKAYRVPHLNCVKCVPETAPNGPRVLSQED